MKVRFWGVRGSIPTPLVPSAIENKILQAIKNLPPGLDPRDDAAVRAYVASLPPLARGTAGGNTSCVEIRSGNTLVIIDAGSGLRELGQELMRGPCGRGQGVIHFLFSHLHWDHVQGFPFFTPAYIPGNRLIFYGIHDIEATLINQQRFETFPIPLSYMRAQRSFIHLEPEQPFSIDDLQITTMLNPHPGDAYSFRIADRHSTLVYASDAEYQELSDEVLQPRIAFFQGADAVIFDAQYTLKEAWQKVDWGHSSAMIGADLVRAAEARCLVLFHHDPTHSDAQLEEIRMTAMAYQAQNPSLPPCEIVIAQEGLTLDLTPPGSLDMRLLPNGGAVLTATSHLDTRGVSLLSEQLTLRASRDTFIDLSQVETLTTADLKALVNLGRTHNDGPLVLISPSPAVQQVIKLGGYSDFFAIYPSVAAAQEAALLRETLNLPGHLLRGRYRIEEAVGWNQLGTALRATDTHTGESVALKVLWPTFSSPTIERLLRYAQQIIRLDHPRIRHVSAVEQEGDVTFMVKEWLTSVTTLAERLTIRPTDTEEALEIAAAVAQGLHYLHSRGVVHGDLKPENVFLTERGVLLSNVSVGRMEEGRALLDTPLLLLDAEYLAPEQILGQPLDARTDLYALGGLLFLLFTGRPPFTGSEGALLQAHLEESPPSPRQFNPSISPSLEHLILKLLAKNPNERYASAYQVAQVLGNLAAGVIDDGRARQALAGREAQRTELLRSWERARAGQGQLTFITGEPGIGKSSLARQVAIQSNAPVVLIGSCRELPTAAAYAPFTEALGAYFTSAPPELNDESLRNELAGLARLVPDLPELTTDLPELPTLDPRQEQLRLMSSLTRFLLRATSRRPWLLIIEDLQWADSGSLELLRAIGRRLPECRMLLISTYRDTDLSREHPLREVLRDLGRYPTFRSVVLDRLDKPMVAEMLEQIWGRRAPEELIAQIYDHTEGNPFYVEALARGLIDEGYIVPTGDMPPRLTATLRLPRTVHDVVIQRIGQLNADTQALLSQAAVLGPSFTFATLHEMSGLSERELLEHLDVALERRIIRESGRAGVLAFSHGEVRTALYGVPGPLRRRRLHGQAARAIERLAEGEPERFAAELAYHYDEAGEAAAALHYSLAAARCAASDYANDTALHWYERALSLSDRLGGVDHERRYYAALEAYEGLAGLLTLIGRRPEAHAAYLQALALAEEYDDRPSQARLQIAVGGLLLAQGELAGAEALYDEALGILIDLGDEAGLMRAIQLRARIALQRGDYEIASTLYYESLAICRRLGDYAGEGHALNYLGMIARELGDLEQARTLVSEGLALRRKSGDRQAIANSLASMGTIAMLEENLELARQYNEQVLLLTREIGDMAQTAYAMNNLGWVLRLSGEYAEAERLINESLLIIDSLNDRPAIAVVLENLASLAALQGHFERALCLAGAATTLRRQIDVPPTSDESQQIEQDLAPARVALDPDAVTAAIAAGNAMSLDEAIAYALERQPSPSVAV